MQIERSAPNLYKLFIALFPDEGSTPSWSTLFKLGERVGRTSAKDWLIASPLKFINYVNSRSKIT